MSLQDVSIGALIPAVEERAGNTYADMNQIRETLRLARIWI